jgi:hypothetical protein
MQSPDVIVQKCWLTGCLLSAELGQWRYVRGRQEIRSAQALTNTVHYTPSCQLVGLATRWGRRHRGKST